MSNNSFAPIFNHDNKYNKYKRIACEKLYPGCEDGHTTLYVIIELHNLKKEFNWLGNSVTELLKRLTQWIPKGKTLPNKYPAMKQMLRDLGMKVKYIHACKNNCMLYWKEYADATECPQCQIPRFKVKEQKKHDSAEWRTLKCKWTKFSNEGRNVWLGIATNGFNPCGVLSSSYSCWLVYVVPYNLPPTLCMKP